MTDLIPVVVAIDHQPYRDAVLTVLREADMTPSRVCASDEVVGMTPEEYANALVLLDTNEDVARLVQTVNNLYRSPHHTGNPLWILCTVSVETFGRNPRLGGWLIDGHAAVFAVWPRWTPDYKGLPHLVRRLSRPPVLENLPPRPTYEQLVNAVLTAPEDAGAVADLVRRLSEWQNDNFMNRELRTALARHVVRLRPDAAESHLLLGRALSIHSQKEEAERELREAIRLEPDNAAAYQALGSLLDFSKPQEALNALETAIRLDPESETARWARNIIAGIKAREQLKEQK